MLRRSNKEGSKVSHKVLATAARFFLAAICCFLMTEATYAQNSNSGEIRGTITDSSGARVPDATVTITNLSTGVAIQAVSGTTGVYNAPSVEPGNNYEIAVTKAGFKRFVRTGIILHVEVITVDAVFEAIRGQLAARR